MAKYKYKALKGNKNIVEGEVEASSLREARQLIRNLGFIPTKVYTEIASQNTSDVPSVQGQNIKHLSLSEKIMFTSELEVLLSSGIPILEALNSIEANASNLKLKKLCTTIVQSIMSGNTFAQALKLHYSSAFGSVYCGLIKAGEDSGELEIVLDRMLVLLRKQENIKGKIVGASIYPAILLVIMAAILILFSKFVFPKFMEVFTFTGATVPFVTQLLIDGMNFIGNFWWLFVISIVSFIYILTCMFKNSAIKSKWDNFVLKIPVVSDFIQYINLANFMTLLSISYESGIPIVSGLELACKTVGNFNIKSKISKALTFVKSGKGLAQAFELTQAIPHTLLSMVSAGEKSGSLGKMFKDCADVIDKKVDMTLDTMTRLFEPTVILIIGAVVLFILVAFYQMYAGMMGSFF
jgi:type II secretory pathway component PulF